MTKVLVLLGLLLAATASFAQTPVVLSTDIGNEIDDQWAIAYMLLNPDFQVLGIISAHAPTIPDPSGYNSYLLLRNEVENHLNMRVHPPIIAGADLPLESSTTPRMNDAVRLLLDQSKGFSANRRLTVIVIGAATDVASAILIDPSFADRVRVVAMAFTNEENAQEYNVQNDVGAWQVLLNSSVPLVIGPGDVCRRDLAMHYKQAETLLASDGPIGSWLWGEYNVWYYRHVKPLRKDDFSRPWMIWDIITMAYLEGMTKEAERPRPVLGDDLALSQPQTHKIVTWITSVDSDHLWSSFQAVFAAYLSTHRVPGVSQELRFRTGSIQ